MMTRKSVDDWIQQNFFRVLGYVVVAVLAYSTLTAQVNDKADKTQLTAVRDSLAEQLRSMRDTLHMVSQRQLMVLRMLCRDPRNAEDTGCPKT